MTVLVFAGPSLPPEVRPANPDFAWRPPAAAGDFLPLLDRPPERLCLIDGYFDARPSVWHKEILLLIAAGVRVFGAVSMGALRAAELDRHGMIGVGAIYRAYASGLIAGDDEVALAHAPGELGWRSLSEPLVEVRATLAAALRRGLLGKAAARTLLAAARAIHFTDRTWPAIFAQAGMAEQRLPPVRLKMLDALLCLEAARTARGACRPYAAPPITCFISALGRETGCTSIAPSRSRTSAMKGALSAGAKAR